MALLAEYALTPDVFDSTSYLSEELGRAYLQYLKEALLNEALVRNLRNGEWLNVFKSGGRPWHQRGKELLKKLVAQGRLRLCPSCLQNAPVSDRAWCSEALASHGVLPLAGIVVTERIAEHFPKTPLIAAINKLSSAPWWASRSHSIRLARVREAYQEHLGLLLQCANSLMFIDAHLDPTQLHYQDFVTLLTTIAGRYPRPLIEIHRVCYVGSGPHRQIISESEWEDRFRSAMTEALQAAGISVEVFVWDDFHDRYVISDLVGIGLHSGLDTTRSPDSKTTWHRLSRRDRDDVQREFDPASKRHVLRARFNVP